jgi:hypothetical protein
MNSLQKTRAEVQQRLHNNSSRDKIVSETKFLKHLLQAQHPSWNAPSKARSSRCERKVGVVGPGAALGSKLINFLIGLVGQSPKHQFSYLFFFPFPFWFFFLVQNFAQI